MTNKKDDKMDYTMKIYYLIAICFITYLLISFVFKTININNIEGALLKKRGLILINVKHILGILLFGVIGYLFIPGYRYLIYVSEVPSVKVLLLLLLVVLVTARLASEIVKRNLKNKKEMSHYNQGQRWKYFPIRLLFLFCYEFFFRGVLFFSLLNLGGLLVAIVFTTMLYVLIHIFDSKEEILGAIPFGIVLCLFSYFTNNIWSAFIIHITLSGMYEIAVFNHLTLKSKKS